MTLKELYNTYNNNFETFMDATKGAILGEEDNYQLKMLFIDNESDLQKYLDCELVSVNDYDTTSHIVIKV